MQFSKQGRTGGEELLGEEDGALGRGLAVARDVAHEASEIRRWSAPNHACNFYWTDNRTNFGGLSGSHRARAEDELLGLCGAEQAREALRTARAASVSS